MKSKNRDYDGDPQMFLFSKVGCDHKIPAEPFSNSLKYFLGKDFCFKRKLKLCFTCNKLFNRNYEHLKELINSNKHPKLF